MYQSRIPKATILHYSQVSCLRHQTARTEHEFWKYRQLHRLDREIEVLTEGIEEMCKDRERVRVVREKIYVQLKYLQSKRIEEYHAKERAMDKLNQLGGTLTILWKMW